MHRVTSSYLSIIYGQGCKCFQGSCNFKIEFGFHTHAYSFACMHTLIHVGHPTLHFQPLST